MIVRVNKHELRDLNSPRIELFCCRRDALEDFEAGNARQEYWRLLRTFEKRGKLHYRHDTMAAEPESLYLIAPRTALDFEVEGNPIEVLTVDFMLDGSYMNCENFMLQFVCGDQAKDLSDQISQKLMIMCNDEELSMYCQAFVAGAVALLPSNYLYNLYSVESKLVKVWRKIKNAPARNYDNESLAESIGMSVNVFTREFRNAFGVSPLRFIMNERLTAAATMLRCNVASIDNIATRSGFCDRYHFSKIFKKYYQVNPAEYRMQFLEPKGNTSELQLTNAIEKEL